MLVSYQKIKSFGTSSKRLQKIVIRRSRDKHSEIDCWKREESDPSTEEEEMFLNSVYGMEGEDMGTPETIFNDTSSMQIGEASTPEEGRPAHSAKVEALLTNLDLERANFDRPKPLKSVVFSCWTKMLDLVQDALRAKGFNYQRIDGQSSLKARSEAMEIFTEDSNCTVMLASIGSAGEGVDFTVAQYVHLLEPHWNPMAEAQAVDRVHRIGQTSPVTITRYIVPESVETYIQWVQSDKLRIINLSFDAMSEDAVKIEERRWQKLQSYLQ
ncbi:P-loop containing nucleoside triphosphate hydrolase protein [Durotheca rogersii]|uniref:P-loop containing nucleoside triphosphate hydrolase protein n=1 Tax=Durotheca rogersii TaxID=419775 RepID=UPI00221EAF20|nr:P-loop containing nucleoside triphosphate hydrolase protein [Durotheca rogersii]KAI5867326.1 P-loop containing nucleoside triphosphate hydrolase protein [Durotheca rogersii]